MPPLDQPQTQRKARLTGDAPNGIKPRLVIVARACLAHHRLARLSPRFDRDWLGIDQGVEKLGTSAQLISQRGSKSESGYQPTEQVWLRDQQPEKRDQRRSAFENGFPAGECARRIIALCNGFQQGGQETIKCLASLRAAKRGEVAAAPPFDSRGEGFGLIISEAAHISLQLGRLVNHSAGRRRRLDQFIIDRSGALGQVA